MARAVMVDVEADHEVDGDEVMFPKYYRATHPRNPLTSQQISWTLRMLRCVPITSRDSISRTAMYAGRAKRNEALSRSKTKPDPSTPTSSSGAKEPADFLMDSTVTLLRALDGSRQRSAASIGVNVTELRVLSRIAEAGHVIPSQLADGMAMTSGAITAISDSLVKAGFVERTAHPTDRRRNLLSLTEEGNATMDRLYQGFTETLSRSVANYSDEQQSIMATMLIAMASSLSATPSSYETDLSV